MSEHFIKNIEIKDFKCFEDFKAEGFGRVNLIGGKNNVGKTAFMEACYIISSQTLNPNVLNTVINFISFEKLRGLILTDKMLDLINIFHKNNQLHIKSNLEEFTLKIKKNMIKERYLVNDIDINLDDTDQYKAIEIAKERMSNFIPSVIINNNLILTNYNDIQKQRKRDKLDKYLKEFYNDISEFAIIEDKPKVFLESKNIFSNIEELGHGLKRYIVIMCAILINKDGFLFIDEIENGIHYTNLDKLWEIILTISKEQNVQVFATTHSKECIESYARVAKRLKDEEITFIELGKNKDSEIKAMVYPYKWFIDEIEQNHEVRGW